MKISIKILQILIIVSPIFLFGWLFWQNYVPGDIFETNYNFERSPWVSALRPGNRLSEVGEDRFKYQSIIDDPIYFDINLPVNFEKIILEIDFKNLLNQPFKIGAFTSRENWQFDWKNFEIISQKDDWQIARVEFDTAYLDKPNNQITFILSTPEIREAGGSVDVREIKVKALK